MSGVSADTKLSLVCVSGVSADTKLSIGRRKWRDVYQSRHDAGRTMSVGHSTHDDQSDGAVSSSY